MNRRTIWRTCSAIVLACVVVLGMSNIAEAASSCRFVAGIKYKGGPGHRSDTYAGIFECGKGKDLVRGQCIDPGKRFPVKGSVKSGDKLPGMNSASTAALRHLWIKHGSTKNNQVAAALAISTWRYQNDPDMNKWIKWSYGQGKKLSDGEARKKRYITKGDMTLSDQMMADAKQNAVAGNWKMSIELQKIAFGQASGVGKITVRNAKNQPLAGIRPTVALSKNAKVVTAVGKTDTAGVASFSFTLINPGEVSAVAKAKQPTGAKWTTYKNNVQRLMVGFKYRTLTAKTKYITGPRFDIAATCDSTCEGVAKVTFVGKLVAGEAAARYTFATGDKVWAAFDVQSGSSVSKTVDIPDATLVTPSAVYLDKSGKPMGKPMMFSKYEVVCPLWVTAPFTGDCDCEGAAGLSFKLTAPGGKRFYVATVKLNGKKVTTKKLGNQGSAPVSVVLSRGDRLTIDFRVYADSSYKKPLRADETIVDLRWF